MGFSVVDVCYNVYRLQRPSHNYLLEWHKTTFNSVFMSISFSSRIKRAYVLRMLVNSNRKYHQRLQLLHKGLLQWNDNDDHWYVECNRNNCDNYHIADRTIDKYDVLWVERKKKPTRIRRLKTYHSHGTLFIVFDPSHAVSLMM